MDLITIAKLNTKFNKMPSGCWEHTYAPRNSVDTYAAYTFTEKGKRRSEGLHRVFYQIYNDKVPRGMLVCHTCDNQKCVNPSHLFLGTHQDNADDKVAKGRHSNGRSERTHCKHGHEFNTPNTRWRTPTSRICITCVNTRNRRRYG